MWCCLLYEYIVIKLVSDFSNKIYAWTNCFTFLSGVTSSLYLSIHEQSLWAEQIIICVLLLIMSRDNKHVKANAKRNSRSSSALWFDLIGTLFTSLLWYSTSTFPTTIGNYLHIINTLPRQDSSIVTTPWSILCILYPRCTKKFSSTINYTFRYILRYTTLYLAMLVGSVNIFLCHIYLK